MTATPVTGAQYEVAAGDYHAVVTELGAGLRELRYRGQPLIAGYEPDELPPGAAGQLLAPWPNRVDGGRYPTPGGQQQLDVSEPARGHAIHGLTRWMPWTAVRHTATEAVLRVRVLGRAGYPFCLSIEAWYQVSAGSGLQVSVTAENLGSRPAPYGTGAHPYLTPADAAPGAVDEWELTLPCAWWLPADERGIPNGAPREVTGGALDFRGGRQLGAASLDHTFSGMMRDGNARAWARLAHQRREVALWAGPGYNWLQVFTGDTLGPDRRRRAVAVEPMTCPPNAFVTGTDLITLEPGASVTHAWGIQAWDRDEPA